MWREENGKCFWNPTTLDRDIMEGKGVESKEEGSLRDYSKKRYQVEEENDRLSKRRRASFKQDMLPTRGYPYSFTNNGGNGGKSSPVSAVSPFLEVQGPDANNIQIRTHISNLEAEIGDLKAFGIDSSWFIADANPSSPQRFEEVNPTATTQCMSSDSSLSTQNAWKDPTNFEDETNSNTSFFESLNTEIPQTSIFPASGYDSNLRSEDFRFAPVTPQCLNEKHCGSGAPRFHLDNFEFHSGETELQHHFDVKQRSARISSSPSNIADNQYLQGIDPPSRSKAVNFHPTESQLHFNVEQRSTRMSSSPSNTANSQHLQGMSQTSRSEVMNFHPAESELQTHIGDEPQPQLHFDVEHKSARMSSSPSNITDNQPPQDMNHTSRLETLESTSPEDMNSPSLPDAPRAPGALRQQTATPPAQMTREALNALALRDAQDNARRWRDIEIQGEDEAMTVIAPHAVHTRAVGAQFPVADRSVSAGAESRPSHNNSGVSILNDEKGELPTTRIGYQRHDLLEQGYGVHHHTQMPHFAGQSYNNYTHSGQGSQPRDSKASQPTMMYEQVQGSTSQNHSDQTHSQTAGNYASNTNSLESARAQTGPLGPYIQLKAGTANPPPTSPTLVRALPLSSEFGDFVSSQTSNQRSPAGSPALGKNSRDTTPFRNATQVVISTRQEKDERGLDALNESSRDANRHQFDQTSYSQVGQRRTGLSSTGAHMVAKNYGHVLQYHLPSIKLRRVDSQGQVGFPTSEAKYASLKQAAGAMTTIPVIGTSVAAPGLATTIPGVDLNTTVTTPSKAATVTSGTVTSNTPSSTPPRVTGASGVGHTTKSSTTTSSATSTTATNAPIPNNVTVSAMQIFNGLFPEKAEISKQQAPAIPTDWELQNFRSRPSVPEASAPEASSPCPKFPFTERLNETKWMQQCATFNANVRSNFPAIEEENKRFQAMLNLRNANVMIPASAIPPRINAAALGGQEEFAALFPSGRLTNNKGLRETLLLHGRTDNRLKIELKDITFYNHTPRDQQVNSESSANTHVNEFVVNYAGANMTVGGKTIDVGRGGTGVGQRCMMCQVDIPNTPGSSDKSSWIYFLIVRPLLSFKNMTGTHPSQSQLHQPPLQPSNVPQGIFESAKSGSWVVFAVPMHCIHEMGTSKETPFWDIADEDKGKVEGRKVEFQFSFGGIPCFEFSEKDDVEDRLVACGVQDDSEARREEWLAASEVDEFVSTGSESDWHNDEYENEIAWLRHFQQLKQFDADRWFHIREMMARGSCRIVARYEVRKDSPKSDKKRGMGKGSASMSLRHS